MSNLPPSCESLNYTVNLGLVVYIYIYLYGLEKKMSEYMDATHMTLLVTCVFPPGATKAY